MTPADELRDMLSRIAELEAIPEKDRRYEDYPVITHQWVKAVSTILLNLLESVQELVSVLDASGYLEGWTDDAGRIE